MKIFLCYRRGDEDLKKAWDLYCGVFENVTVTVQPIIDLEVDAIVAPANSFGQMTGGLDLLYKNYIGASIEADIQNKIAFDYFGELPVGMAEAIKITNSPVKHIKYVIFAPTMRVPETVKHTVNSFLAAKAALIKAESLGLDSIAFPGLATGTGSMWPGDCALQVAEAIKYVLVDKKHLRNPKDLYEEQDLVRKMAPSFWLDLQ